MANDEWLWICGGTAAAGREKRALYCGAEGLDAVSFSLFELVRSLRPGTAE